MLRFLDGIAIGGMLPLVLGVNEDGRFDFDQYLLRPEVKRVLDDLASKLKTAEYDRLDVTGYTDRIGTVDHNQRLSELRAYAVAHHWTLVKRIENAPVASELYARAG